MHLQWIATWRRRQVKEELKSTDCGYKMEAHFHILFVFFESTTEKKHRLSELQKKYPNSFHMYLYIYARLGQEKEYICVCTGKQPSDTSHALEYTLLLQ